MLGGGNRNLLDNAGSSGVAPMLTMLKSVQPSQQPVQQYQPQPLQPAPVSAPLFQPAAQTAPKIRANTPGAQLDFSSSQPRMIK
jgi:hypothetical protein